MEGIDEVQGKRKKTRPPRGAARRSNCPHTYSHPFEVRRKAVQLCLEESFPVERVAREMGVGRSTLSKWVRLYRDQGEAGLQSKSAGREPSAAESCGGGEGGSRRTQASSSRLGHQEDQPVSAAHVVSAGEPGDGSPDVTSSSSCSRSLGASPSAIPPSRASSSAPRPTRCGRPISSPSGWEARTPTSSASSTITPATWWGWRCFAARRRSTCWRCTAGRWRSTACPKRCSPIKAASTRVGAGPPGSRRSCARIGFTTSRAGRIIP